MFLKPRQRQQRAHIKGAPKTQTRAILNIRGKNNVPTDISDTKPVITQKLLRDGRLLILRGEKMYTIDGREVR